VRPDEFAARFAEAAAELTSGGANPNPIFTGMMAVNQLGELGLRPDGKHEDDEDARDSPDIGGSSRSLAFRPT